MGTNGSKHSRVSGHSPQYLDDAARREQLRRYLQGQQASYGVYPNDAASSEEGSTAFFYPPSPLGRSQSEHNIVYIEKSRSTKSKSTFTKKLAGWMRRIGGKGRRSNSPSERAVSEMMLRPELHGRHRVLSKSDSGLDNDMDNVSLVRSEATYQDLETPNLVRRFGSCDMLREGNNAQGEMVMGSDGIPIRTDHRFIPHRPSPALPSRHWSKRRRGFGTCRSEPPQRTAFQVGQSYQIPIGKQQQQPDGGRTQRSYYNFHSVPGHYHSRWNNPYIADVQQTHVKQPYAAPSIPCSPSPSHSQASFNMQGWVQQQQPNPQNLLKTVSESQGNLEIYNSTVDRKVNSPAFNQRSFFVANRSKSASTGCLSQADSGVGQDWVEKSMDFDDDNLFQFSIGDSYERIADVRAERPRAETSTQTNGVSEGYGSNSCGCQPQVIKHYHNCTFIVNPKGLQVGNSSQMHYNSLPKEVQEMCRYRDDGDCDSNGMVEVEYAVEEIPCGTIV